jgi:hypothetical protein
MKVLFVRIITVYRLGFRAQVGLSAYRSVQIFSHPVQFGRRADPVEVVRELPILEHGRACRQAQLAREELMPIFGV